MSPGSGSSAASSAAGIGTGNGLAFGFLGYAQAGEGLRQTEGPRQTGQESSGLHVSSCDPVSCGLTSTYLRTFPSLHVSVRQAM